MTKTSHDFAEMLTTAVRKIKAVEGKNLDVIQDELGFLMNREGASYINYLRKGNVPNDPCELEALTRTLLSQQGLVQADVARFLKAGGHSDWQSVALSLTSHSASAMNGDCNGHLHAGFQPDATFVAGPPITKPHQFFGRERELRRIFSWLKPLPMSHIALVGPKRSGKTSLLHYLRRIHATSASTLRCGQKQDWLPNASAYRWVWVDFQNASNRRLDHLLRHILTELDMPTPATSKPCDLDAFMDIVSSPLRWRRPTIIVMDDIGDSLRVPELSQTMWDSFKALTSSVTEGKLAFIISAHEDPAQLADKQSQTSHFFNIFNTIQLGPLAKEEARELITCGAKEIVEDDVEWILSQSHRWPLLVQMLCQEWQMSHEDGLTDDMWKVAGLQRINAFSYLKRDADTHA